MKKPLIVGLTGGIGSGKSVALAEFRKRGAEIVDSDALARAQARRGGAAYKNIVRAFGRGVVGKDGELDRKALAEKVFSQPALRRKLEKATHPPVIAEIARRKKAAKGVMVVDVPLLFEGRHEKLFDVTMTVAAPLSKRVARVVRRDGSSRAQALARVKAQLSDARRAELADVVVDNAGTEAAFRKTISQYAKAFHLMQNSEQTVPK